MPHRNRKKSIKFPKGYGPRAGMDDIMRDLLWHQDDVAGEQDVNKKHKRYLDKEKVRLLNDYVFPSMANIIFFFRAVSMYPHLKELFENDIKDLLGVRRENPEPDNYGYVFSSLVRSVLFTEGDVLYFKKEMPGEGFSLHLNQILQEIVWDRVDAYLTKVFKNSAEQRVVEEDFKRVLAWVRMIAESMASAAEDGKPPHRTLPSGYIQLREDDLPIKYVPMREDEEV